MASGTSAAQAKVSQAQFRAMEDPDEEPSFSSEPIPSGPIVEKPERVSSTEPKSGPPSIDEWQDFFARFVIRLLVDAYLYLMLGDLVDELTPEEAKSIQLSKEDLQAIASPLAETANKSSYMKKHGRSIIALAESYESVMTLLFWMNRVRRVSNKHRKTKPRTVKGQAVRQEENNNAQHDGYNPGEVNGVNGVQFGVFNPGTG